MCVGGGGEVCEHLGQDMFKCTQLSGGSTVLRQGCSGRSIAGASRWDLDFFLTRDNQTVLQIRTACAIACMGLAPGGY